MKLHKHFFVIVLSAAVVLFAGVSQLKHWTQPAYATCGAGVGIGISSPGTNSAVSGSVNLSAIVSASSPTQPSSVTFSITAPTSIVLGNATLQTIGTQVSWVLPWNSTAVPDGSYQLVALAHFGVNPANDCSSTAVPLLVQNTSGNPTFAISPTISPISLVTTPGAKLVFTVGGNYTKNGVTYPILPSSGATFLWDTNAGSLSSSSAPSTTLVVGRPGGMFAIGVTVTLNGISQVAVTSVKVVLPPQPTGGTSPSAPPNSNSPQPTQNPSGSSTSTNLIPQQVALLATQATIFRPTTPTNSDPVVPVSILACLEEKMGSDYALVSSGAMQPTDYDRTVSAACFSGNNPIPSSLAPVIPTHITEVPQDNSIVSVSLVQNTTVKNSSGTKTVAIALSGTGKPSSDIYLYVFSDPLVLRAQTDNQGKWSYILENPLKPGHHEIYAVSSKDASTFVRSSAIPVSIAAAAPGSQDGSLVIESGLQASQVAYIGIGLLFIVLAFFIVLRLRGSGTPTPSLVSGSAVTAVNVPNVVQPVPDSSPLAPTISQENPPDHDPQV
ncbi:MAG: hypothetical protein ACHQUB_01695 [Candidatus Saccharimonadia bacterium]